MAITRHPAVCFTRMRANAGCLAAHVRALFFTAVILPLRVRSQSAVLPSGGSLSCRHGVGPAASLSHLRHSRWRHSLPECSRWEKGSLTKCGVPLPIGLAGGSGLGSACHGCHRLLARCAAPRPWDRGGLAMKRAPQYRRSCNDVQPFEKGLERFSGGCSRVSVLEHDVRLLLSSSARLCLGRRGVGSSSSH